MCKDKILSNEYYDFIWELNQLPEFLDATLSNVCMENLGLDYVVLHVKDDFFNEEELDELDYQAFPTCFTLLQIESLEQAGILSIQEQPVLQLKGKDVLIGFLDTGIDYRNTCFQKPDGSTRILRIWDQSIQIGNPPQGILYGSEYFQEQINEALKDETQDLVPSRDENGHGTLLASIAAGSENRETGTRGAAPEVELAVVKLKEAKENLKDYYLIEKDTICYQETDLMMGINYLSNLARMENKPLVICLALGSNMGGHNGTGPFNELLDFVASQVRRCIVVAGGNEGNESHHYEGKVEEGTYEDVEIRVGRDTGFQMEIWGSIPDVFAVSVISPTGESTPVSVLRKGRPETYNFLFEGTKVVISQQSLEGLFGDQMIAVRMKNPAQGIWKLRIYGRQILEGTFHVWLPIRGFISDETILLRSNPNITLTNPGNTRTPIAVCGYNGNNGSTYIDSSRGYTRRGRIKPDLVAPAVEVEAIAPRNRQTTLSGTSASAALTAGAATLMMEWGIVRGNSPQMNTTEIKNQLIRGARREAGESYPNRKEGYGKLDLFNTFENIRRL